VSSGLDFCACKRGFYTLRDCGKPATTTCSVCSRRVCDEHLAPRIDAKVCVECAAKQREEGTAAPAGAQAPAPDPSAWATMPSSTGGAFAWGSMATFGSAWWRQRYYGYGYRPMYWGTYDPYYQPYGYIWYGDDDDDNDFDDS
jgi:hypothetical protein